jgi:hypothetical protein
LQLKTRKGVSAKLPRAAPQQVRRQEARAGHRHVAHDPQRLHAAALQGFGDGRHAAQHRPLTQAVVGEILIVHDQLQPVALAQPLLDQAVQRRQHPGRQAVGVDGDGQPRLRRDPLAQLARHVHAQRLQLAGEAQQTLPASVRRGGPSARPAAAPPAPPARSRWRRRSA